MPNIEIHGIGRDDAPLLQQKIAYALAGAPYAKDVVITNMNNTVNDIKGDAQPFLRVVATAADGSTIFAQIGRRLAKLNMDTEELLLHGFVPKKK